MTNIEEERGSRGAVRPFCVPIVPLVGVLKGQENAGVAGVDPVEANVLCASEWHI